MLALSKMFIKGLGLKLIIMISTFDVTEMDVTTNICILLVYLRLFSHSFCPWDVPFVAHMMCDKRARASRRLEVLKVWVKEEESSIPFAVCAAAPHRLGSGWVLPPRTGVQRQSGLPLLQRTRALGRLSGTSTQPANQITPGVIQSQPRNMQTT